jgi:acetyl esterase/lipase
MRLWDDEIEAMRPEARDAVREGFDVINDMIGVDEAGRSDDPLERAEAARALFARMYAPVPEAVDREIAGVPCRLFLPDDPATAVYLHFHGGGMILGAPVMNDLGNRDLCRRFGMAVVSVDYRLAPEHPVPAGPDDCFAVAAWLVEHGERELGSRRILVGGESAGGYLAALVPLRMRDELDAVDRVLGCNLVFGVFDWGRSPSQRGLRPHDGPDVLAPGDIEHFANAYLPGRSDDERRDPSISPLYADLRGMPPALMSVGTCDHLVDDTLMLATRWAAAGNDLDLFVAPEMPHGFMAYPCAMTDAWVARTYEWIGARLAD